MGRGEEGYIELEAKRKDDQSWHPCQISLSSHTSSGSGLTVEFRNSDSEDIITSEEEAVERLRIRSIPLEDGDCIGINEGQHILAMRKTQFRSLFFDAEVEKICRVKHSLRVHCRCSFVIRWLPPELKGETTTVSSSSIWKLARSKIHSHPTVAAFFDSLNTLNGSIITSHNTVLNDLGYKADLHKLLEEQIEEISKVADACSTATPEDTILGLRRVNCAHGSRRKVYVASEISSLHDKTPCNQNKRLSRSQGKLQLKIESKDLSEVQNSQEESSQKLLCLNPLAARAALASLKYELPQKSEISFYHVEKEGYIDLSQDTREKCMDVLSLDVTRMHMNSDICVQENLSVVGNHSSEVVPPSLPVVSNPIQLANDAFGESMLESGSCFSGRRSSSKKSQLEGSVLETMEDRTLETPTVTARFTRSVMNRKSNSTPGTTRVTRSRIQKDAGNATDKPKLESSTKDGNLNSPIMSNTLTPLANKKEMVMESSTKDRKVNTPSVMRRVIHSASKKETGQSVDEFKLKSTTKDSPANSRFTRSMVENNVENSLCEITPESSNKVMKLNSPVIKRLTRSAAKKEMENSIEEVEPKSSSKDEKLSSPTIGRRSTRSVSQKEVNLVNDMKFESSTRNRKVNSPTVMKRLTRSAVQMEMGNLMNEVEANPLTKVRELDSQKETGYPAKEAELGSSSKDWQLNSISVSKRLTRSSAQGALENSTSKNEEEREKRNLTQDSGTHSAMIRSANQKDKRYLSKEVELDSPVEDFISNSTAISKRLTRSAAQREMDNSTTKDEKEQEKRKLILDWGSTAISKRLTRSVAQRAMDKSTTKHEKERDKRKLIQDWGTEDTVDSSSKARKLEGPVITRSTRCTSQKEAGHSAKLESHSPLEDQKLSGTAISKRFTRSAAQRALENLATKNKEREKRKLTQDFESIIVDLVSLEDCKTMKKRSVSSSSNASQGSRKMVEIQID